MNPTQLYEQFSALEDPGFWQQSYMNFYRAWFEGNRWQQYLEGLGTTVLVTILALCIGVVLGVLVAVIRTGHDQQRKGKHNPILAVLNLICKIYVTVIRGTPMMVQLLIMAFVVFKSSRNFTLVGALALGINSGAYVAEIIRGGLMSLDPGQSEAGRSLGLGYLDHHAPHCGAPGFQGHSARPGQRVHHPAEGHLFDLGGGRQGDCLLCPGNCLPYLRGHVALSHHRC